MAARKKATTLVSTSTSTRDHRLREIAAELRALETGCSIAEYHRGELYSEANGLTKNFSKWVKDNTGQTRQHAYNFISLYKTFRLPHRQPAIRVIDATGLMLLSTKKLAPYVDNILSMIMEDIRSSIRPFIVTASMVSEFIRLYGPKKEHREHKEHEDQETNSNRTHSERTHQDQQDTRSRVRNEAYAKFYRQFRILLTKMLEQDWTPETYSAARDNDDTLPHFDNKFRRDLRTLQNFSKKVR